MSYQKRTNSNSDNQSAEAKSLERFAELMIARIKEIQTDWQKPWFTEGAMQWPRNMDGREYNGGNALGLILHSENNGYKIPVFVTFNRIVGMNFGKDKKPLTDANGEKLPTVAVNRGEKSFPVFITTYTVVDKETHDKIPFEEYKKLSREEREKYIVFPKSQVFNVFNLAAQTNLKETRPELYAELEAKYAVKQPETVANDNSTFPALDEMIRNSLWYCPIKMKYQNNAYYSPANDEIVVPERSQYLNGEALAGTCLHEMTHSTGVESRLNRFKIGEHDQASYSREELVAELTAALVCARYNLTKNIKSDSAAYLKAWLENMQESPEYLKTILQDVKKASSMITHRLDLIQEQIDDYQEEHGKDVYPDFYDLDGDNDRSEACYVAKDGDVTLKPEEVAAKSISRGR
jgi:antirestriction protein ArdC